MSDNPVAPPLVVMVFLHSFEPGGVERTALRLCGAWAGDAAIDVRLVMGREDGAMRAQAPATVPRHVIGSAGVPTAAWETLWMMIVLWRQVRAQRPDVLFAAGNTYAIVAVAMKLLLGRRCPPVVMKISNDLVRRDLPAPVRRVYRLWLRVQGRLIDAFTGLAEPMRAEIITAMRVPAARVHVIDDPALDAADLAALAAIGAGRDHAAARRYVGVGRLAGQKNWRLLVAAFARARQAGDTLTIVGEGSERRRLERQVTALGLGDCVRLPGHGAAAPALAAADVFVLSSDYEGVPAVVIEALASGLPVVATDCSVSMRGLVGDFGTLVPVGDAAALATAMQAQALPSAEMRARQAAAMRGFTAERAARAYARLFGDVARRATETAANRSARRNA